MVKWRIEMISYLNSHFQRVACKKSRAPGKRPKRAAFSSISLSFKQNKRQGRRVISIYGVCFSLVMGEWYKNCNRGRTIYLHDFDFPAPGTLFGGSTSLILAYWGVNSGEASVRSRESNEHVCVCEPGYLHTCLGRPALTRKQPI